MKPAQETRAKCLLLAIAFHQRRMERASATLTHPPSKCREFMARSDRRPMLRRGILAMEQPEGFL